MFAPVSRCVRSQSRRGASTRQGAYISGRIKELDGKKQELMKRISELKLHKDADYTEISNHLTMWDELSFDDKRQTVDQLIRVIYATSDSIKIEWRI